MRWRYPLSVADLEDLPRGLLQRVQRTIEEEEAYLLSSPAVEAQLAAQWALVRNFDEVRPLREITWNRIRDILGLPRLDDAPPR